MSFFVSSVSKTLHNRLLGWLNLNVSCKEGKNGIYVKHMMVANRFKWYILGEPVSIQFHFKINRCLLGFGRRDISTLYLSTGSLFTVSKGLLASLKQNYVNILNRIYDKSLNHVLNQILLVYKWQIHHKS